MAKDSVGQRSAEAGTREENDEDSSVDGSDESDPGDTLPDAEDPVDEDALQDGGRASRRRTRGRAAGSPPSQTQGELERQYEASMHEPRSPMRMQKVAERQLRLLVEDMNGRDPR